MSYNDNHLIAIIVYIHDGLPNPPQVTCSTTINPSIKLTACVIIITPLTTLIVHTHGALIQELIMSTISALAIHVIYTSYKHIIYKA